MGYIAHNFFLFVKNTYPIIEQGIAMEGDDYMIQTILMWIIMWNIAGYVLPVIAIIALIVMAVKRGKEKRELKRYQRMEKKAYAKMVKSMSR